MDERIGQSSLTLAELERELQLALNTKATFGEKRSITQLSPGRGFMSDIYKLEPNWVNVEDGKDLPQELAVKMFITPSVKGRAGSFMDVTEPSSEDQRYINYHNAEVTVLQTLDANELTIPKVFVAKPVNEFGTGYLVMSFLKGIPLQQADNLPHEAMMQMLSFLAKFHASGKLFKKDDNPQMLEKVYTTKMVPLRNPQLVQSFKDAIRKRAAAYPEDCEAMAVVYDEINTPEHVEWCDNTNKDLGMDDVLCHGDVWICNTMWNEEWKLLAVIDYQVVHYGCPAADLVRFITGCLSGAERRKRTDEYLEKYYEMFCENWTEEKRPFTLEQLKAAYKRLFPISGSVAASFIPLLHDLIIGQKPEEEREATKQRAEEKLVCLIQDIATTLKEIRPAQL